MEVIGELINVWIMHPYWSVTDFSKEAFKGSKHVGSHFGSGEYFGITVQKVYRFVEGNSSSLE